MTPEDVFKKIEARLNLSDYSKAEYDLTKTLTEVFDKHYALTREIYKNNLANLFSALDNLAKSYTQNENG
jgi:hypothetical protein